MCLGCSNVMAYKITYAQAFNTTSEQWSGTLEEAQARATRCVVSGTADYVEIRTLDGKFVDGYPPAVGNFAN